MYINWVYRVFIITGLRIQALHLVNAQDFTYSKGYLGLLSTLGASLGIITCCAPAVRSTYLLWREASSKRAARNLQIDEENAALRLEISVDIASIITWDDRSARWSIDDCVVDAKSPPYGGLKKHRTIWKVWQRVSCVSIIHEFSIIIMMTLTNRTPSYQERSLVIVILSKMVSSVCISADCRLWIRALTFWRL